MTPPSFQRISRFWLAVTSGAVAGTAAAVAALVMGTTGARADSVVTTCTTAGLQAAINGGGLVTFNCGPGPVTITIAPTLVVTAPVTIDGANNVTLDGLGATRIISVAQSSALTLTNMTLKNGNANDGQGGGAVRIGLTATLAVINARFAGNLAQTSPAPVGGALFAPNGSTVTAIGSTFEQNRSDVGGAITAYTATIRGSSFFTNTSAGGAGGINANAADIAGSVFVSNTGSTGSGGINAFSAVISTTVFRSNAGSYGGGLNAYYATIERSTFLSNTASSSGGGVNANFLTIRDSDVRANTAQFSGGGLNTSAFTVTAVTFERNAAQKTGGGGLSGSGTVSSATFISNTAESSGGGAINGHTVEMTNSRAVENRAKNGGAVSGFDVSIAGSTLERNQATQDGGGVSGLYVTILDTVVSDGTSEGSSGGALSAAYVRSTNSTLSGNGAALGGGAVYFNTSLAMTNTTVTGSGIKILSGTTSSVPFTLTNSIVAGTGGALCAYPGTLAGKNVIQDASCGTGAAAVVADPQLGPLQDNGGPTLTRAPQPGSPAIGAASGCLPTDQRRYARIAPCDIGAYETGIAPVLVSLNPASAGTFDPSVTITVTGLGFLPETAALLDGSPRPTTVLNSTVLLVTVPAADLVTARGITVQARYALATDSTSNALPFTVVARQQRVLLPSARKDSVLE